MQTIANIDNDSRWKARQLLLDIADAEMGKVRMHNALPLISKTLMEIKWTGSAAMGADNHAFFAKELGLSTKQIERLGADGVICLGGFSGLSIGS